ncbi:hypothetical protein Tco_1494195 [Tanacetum coccineum]
MPRKKFHELAQHLQEVMEESLPEVSQADVAKMIADAIQQERENLRAKISLQINNAIYNHIPSQVDSSVRNYMSGHILHVRPTQASPTSAQEQQYQLYMTMKDNPQLQQDDLPIWLALKYKFERLHVSDTSCRPSAVCLRDQDDPHYDAHPGGRIVQRGRRRLSMEPMCLENRYLVKTMKVNQVHQHQTYWEQGHEHKFITEVIARRENGSIVSITESNYKNLNNNDIEDLYLLIVNGKVDDYAETELLWSLSVFIRSIEKYKIVLEGLKSYNNNVKHGYLTPSLSKEDVEYLQLFEEEIKERLKHRDQMRRWEMYMNERPLGSRRERPE